MTKHMTIATTGLVLSLALCFGGLSACAAKTKLEGNQDVSAEVQGEMTTKNVSGNTQLNLKVRNLKAASEIVEGATNYVVWIQPDNADYFQNVGTLSLQQDQEASYMTLIPHKAFRVLVTPESSVAVREPTGPSVFQDVVESANR